MNTRRLFLLNLIFSMLPPSRFYLLKRVLMRWAGAKIGENVRIVSTARFHLTGELDIGDQSYIGDYVLIVGGDARVAIGRDVAIGPRCTLVTGSHELFSQPNIAAGNGFSSPILIGDGVWLGTSTTVLGGVSVGTAAILAAGALVRDDVPEHCVVGGVPARVISVKRTNQLNE